ncbi:MAG: hypothetical protein E7266_03435 [Lachnospiraceae bacterium]|nr:hypothetical protein [Lachnospiraceae bacterium]
MSKPEYQILKKYLIITLIGFLVLLMGRGIGTGMQIYPPYQPDAGVGPEFQYYTLNTFYGARVNWETENIAYTGYRFPLFALAGYVLIIMGFGKLSTRSKVFSIGKVMCIGAVGCVAVLNVLPFLLNGTRLCWVTLLLGIAALGFEISAGYFLLCGMCNVLYGIAFKTDRVLMAIVWCLAVLCRIVVFVTTWVQLGGLTFVYNIILFWLWIFFLYCIWKLNEFITGEISMKD